MAVGLLTSSEVALVGAQLSRLYPLEAGSPFDDLIEAIDRADRETHLKANAAEG